MSYVNTKFKEFIYYTVNLLSFSVIGRPSGKRKSYPQSDEEDALDVGSNKRVQTGRKGAVGTRGRGIRGRGRGRGAIRNPPQPTVTECIDKARQAAPQSSVPALGLGGQNGNQQQQQQTITIDNNGSKKKQTYT